MDARTAVAEINSIHFMPGWRISARLTPGDTWTWAPDRVRVTCEVDTVNSDRDMAIKGYPEEITIAPSMVIDAHNISSRDELYAGILGWLVEIFTHEAREFLRVGDGMDAPFHPHKAEGDARLRAAVA